MKKVKKIRGSAILVVIFSSIAFFIYVMSVYSETEHFSVIQNKYEKNIKKFYQQSKEKEELTEISLNKHLKNLNYLIKDINND